MCVCVCVVATPDIVPASVPSWAQCHSHLSISSFTHGGSLSDANMHHIYICLHIASLGLLVHRRGELTCVHLNLLWMLEPDSYLDCDWSAAGHVTRPGAAIGWMLEPDV